MSYVNLETNTLSVLIAGLYCVNHMVDSIAIPQSVWLSIAEKLEYFLSLWDYDIISFEEWIDTHLLILPKPMLSDEELTDLQSNTLYWETPNGNVILIISMNMGVING